MAAWGEALAGAGGQQDARARVGAMALAARTVDEHERRDIIGARLPSVEWPQWRLIVTAVDAATGELVLLDSSAGVGLLDAVAASCAVPGIWPPATVAGRRLIDGGIRSVTNADLAQGCDRVLVLAPLPGTGSALLGPTLAEEVAGLERDGAVLVPAADAEALAAVGANPLVPATRGPAARAGMRQGTAVAAAVRGLWEALP